VYNNCTRYLESKWGTYQWDTLMDKGLHEILHWVEKFSTEYGR